MNSRALEQVGEAVGLEDHRDDVGLVGLVELDEPVAQRRARLGQAGAQLHEPDALLAQLVLDAVELGALARQVGLDPHLALLQRRDVALQVVDAVRVALDRRREDALAILLARRSARRFSSMRLEIGAPSDRTGTDSQSTKGSAAISAMRRRRDMRRAILGGVTPPYGACNEPCTSRVRKGSVKQAIPAARMMRTMARPTSFGKDTGLQLRMAFTMFLLGLVYVVLIVALLRLRRQRDHVALIAGGLAAFQLFGSDKLALRAMGAREVTPAQAPELHAMIDRLCVQADLPKPRVAVADTRMPNAFALGRSPKNATVCATTGIMELLSPAELEGVMAHELTHVANRDVLVMTLASFFATIAAYIVQFGFLFGGGHGDDDDNPSVMVLFLVSIGVYVVSFFLMQALSRYREFAADRGAALITGRPSALSSALMKISSGMQRIPQSDLRAQQELAAFYIFPPGAGKSIGALFSTHPPMEKRIAALERLEMQLQGDAA